ncbi:M1 family metallopeptidase [Rhodocytophaga aerolata]|uniref:M1 family metallopeptidase n=1 Tax=Rhodocytophaga aerolata TaxID=455078 RepID=A0ABT8QYV8_9BACT|nr:M1 family metallopeptidase [Rhodocytophaga aerolata]MDO1444859.1 M1 family metallopeptidase [Rhodocytophaga aerolata]
MKRVCFLIFCCTLYTQLWAQEEYKPANSKFEQLGTMLPTPNTYRSASGAPGPDYWQQKADYDIKVQLDDEKQHITGSEVITYTNNSPDELTYLWVQLDQNLFSKDSDTYKTETGTLNDNLSFDALDFVKREKFDGGYKITAVKEKSGAKLTYNINKTMMRIDLPRPLKPKGTFAFSIDWNYNINDQKKLGGRTGFEYFEKDGNYLYEIAQWFPRMAVYDDVYGWQHKQFLGQGEFALPFGDYKVAITVPADHIVAATGECQNLNQVLTSTQLKRWEKAKNTKEPVVIVTQQEAEQAEKSKAKGTKTWVYQAKNVRDFAWASSRKFIWDAMQVNIAGKKVWAMSYYPKEGNPLWGQYSTRVVAHTLQVYSKHTIDYPYPVAISVHGPVFGMEYPMICFNGGRPEPDGTYSEQIKYAMISVIIHEVGHNFFPMIVNSDERQWSWMDEGLNSFCQFLAEQEWQRDYPSRRGEPYKIVPYMKSDPTALVPIMTNSEQIMQFGANAYGKPATALNILRETVMGRELFDYAFKEYSRRWAFKHPHPADFFRTMEDASGVDLDWFWRGWFYSTNPVEIALADVTHYQINTQNPEVEKPLAKEQANPQTLSKIQNAKDIKSTLQERDTAVSDFYNSYDPYQVTQADRAKYQRYYNSLTPEEKELVDSGLNFYVLSLKNNGGTIMPLIIKMDFEDGTEKVVRIPAEVWRMNNQEINKVLFTEKPVAQFTLDPYLETADIDTENNAFPRKSVPTRFQLYKERKMTPKNPMQQQREAAGQMNTN